MTNLRMIAAIAFLPLVLAACENGAPDWVTNTFPNTTQGFEQGGILGAVDGATDAILARCRMLDGAETTLVVDSAAAAVGSEATSAVDRIRVVRRRACELAGAVQFFADGNWRPVAVAPETSPEPAVKPES